MSDAGPNEEIDTDIPSGMVSESPSSYEGLSGNQSLRIDRIKKDGMDTTRPDDELQLDQIALGLFIKNHRFQWDHQVTRSWNSMTKLINQTLAERRRYRKILESNRQEIGRRLADAQMPEPDFEAWVRRGKIRFWLVRQGFLEIRPEQMSPAFKANRG